MVSYLLEKEEISLYDSYQNQSEEYERDLYVNETDHGAPLWQEEDCSESDFDDEPGAGDFNPEPPVRCTTMQSFSEPIESWYEEENYYGGESWQEPDYTDLEEESYAEPHPQRNESKPLAQTSQFPWSYTQHHSFRVTYKDQTRLFYDNGYKYFEPEYFLFDGTYYIGWETKMDTYFWN